MKFVFRLGKHVKECKVASLIFNMDISKLVMYAHQVKDDKKKDRQQNLIEKTKLVGHESDQKQGEGKSLSYSRYVLAVHHHQQVQWHQTISITKIHRVNQMFEFRVLNPKKVCLKVRKVATSW